MRGGKEKRRAVRIRPTHPQQVRLSFVHEEKTYEGALWDYSRFGLGIQIPGRKTPFRLNQLISDIHIEAFGDGRRLGDGRIVRENVAEEHLFLGVSLLHEFIDLEFLQKNRKILLQSDELSYLRSYLKYVDDIRPEFKSFASDFAYGLSVFKAKLDELDVKFEDEPEDLREDLFRTIVQGIGKELAQFVTQSMEKLKTLPAAFGREEHERHGFYLRRTIWAFLMESAFYRRTNLKPRGYAGDSTLMEMIYANDYVGESSFGKIMHKHPLEEPMSRAVRNRRGLVCDLLDAHIEETSRPSVKVVSIACGPAREMQDFLTRSPHRDRVRLYLLDQDSEALEEARRNLASLENGDSSKITYIRDSVRTLLKKSNPILSESRFDFVYSMGLFDYLSQPVAKAILSRLFEMLDSKGRLVVGNFHKTSPNRTYLNYFLDWPLIYRDEDAMRDLAAGLSGIARMEVGFESSGCQMFLDLHKS